MFDRYQEEMDYEFNAQFDYVREAYAATELDPYHEGYCDYLNDCEQEGDDPLGFDDWKASLREVRTAPTPLVMADYGDDEIPF